MSPASANPAGNGLVINEVYGGGGNSGAIYKSDFIELYNPTDAAIPVSGMSVQYRSKASVADPSGVIPLEGSVPAKSYYLVGGATGSVGEAIPTPNVSSTVNLSGTDGTVFLANQTGALAAPTAGASGASTANPKIVDLVGFGTSNTWEGPADSTSGAVAPSNTKTITRNGSNADSDVNAADFALSDGSPTAAPTTPPGPDPDPTGQTIPEIQGTTDTSPFVGKPVTTKGVVTAAYPTGGFAGVYIQTPGTGGEPADNHTASNGLFVYLGNAAADTYPEVGDYVETTGDVSEYFGLTQVTDADKSLTELTETAAPVRPTQLFWPADASERESFEGMLIAPQGGFTVADNYSLNQYGEITLARGSKPLVQPTDVARPKSPEAAAVAAQNAARAVKIDDGSTLNFLTTAKNTPLPWLTGGPSIRVGAPASFTKPVVLDYRNSSWKFEPTQQLTAANAATVQQTTFENTRTAHPEAVGGDLKIASFNVLNYFTETGTDYESDSPSNDCSFYNDRDGNPITVNTCNGDGPRGAATKTNRLRQQEKVVRAINSLGADVLSLEEIENSAKYAGAARRDDALATLVTALNDDAAAQVWDYVRSPSARPATSEEDVIRTAFIYKKAKATPVGTSKILTGSAAFANAREPLAQVFKPVGGSENQQFLVVVNHFKSKGSGSGADADQGDGQGGSNASRVAQAKALVAFVKEIQDASGTKRVYLTGDFNSYTQEDPMQVLYQAGFTDIGAAKTDEATYLFDGVVGSLDHVLANAAGYQAVAGADVWNINSVESVAYEYSRYNYNATNFYAPNAYRSSDHDPLVVGINTPAANDDATLNLLNINDFHGRIDANTVGFAATIEKLRDQGGEDNTLLGSAGDNIGASLFSSSSDGDLPTIDVLNALDLQSSVGNHEFDKGYDDLTGRVAAATDWDYLGANVFKANGDRALDAYSIVPVNGVKVGVIGAVTEETPSLVTPSGINGLQFKDPVASVNEVADDLTDGDQSNGEADVIVAEYHEGAPEGTPEGATLEKEVALGGAFASIVNETSPKVAAIFTAHTHKQYVWDGPAPGAAGKTRPIIQTGSYGETVGRVTMTVNRTTGEVSSYTSGLAKRLTATDTNNDKVVDATEQKAFDNSMVAQYGHRVAEVQTIVDNAIAKADVAGKPQVGTVGHDITTAFLGGSYGANGYTVTNPNDSKVRDDRASESTLGNTVANMLRDTMATDQYGNAEIGVTNPGGLRAELFYAGTPSPDTNKDGVVTLGEANSVLPFANNLYTVKLTGAQFKAVLEQQWQTNPDGSVPSRPFLHLGLSDNVTTVLDPSRARGDRVTSVRIDGEPLDLTRTYTIGTFSFLATGGDNFRAFKEGKSTDTGLTDADGWFAYLKNHQEPPLEPAFDRREVFGTGVPQSIGAGDEVSFGLTKLNLTSLGSPANSTVEVVMHTADGDTPVEGSPFAVTDGAATVAFTAPATIPAGATFVATAKPSGTTVTIPATGTAVPSTDTVTTATVSPSRVVVRSTRATVTATVKDADGNPVTGGTVNVSFDGRNLGSATVSNGTARVVLPVFGATGLRPLDVRYTGVAGTTSDSSTRVSLTVVKATPVMKVTVSPSKIHRGKTHPKLTIRLTAPGQTVSGYVTVGAKGKQIAHVRLVNGRATVTLPTYATTGVKHPGVRYDGSSIAAPVFREVSFRVVK